MKTAFFWGTVQRVVLIPYRRFGTTYRSHIRSETSVRNYHYSLRNTPEEGRSRHMIYFFDHQQDGWNVCDSVVRQRSGYDAGFGLGQEHGRMWKSSEILGHDVSNCFQLHLQDRAVQNASGLLVFTDGHSALFHKVGNIYIFFFQSTCYNDPNCLIGHQRSCGNVKTRVFIRSFLHDRKSLYQNYDIT